MSYFTRIKPTFGRFQNIQSKFSYKNRRCNSTTSSTVPPSPSSSDSILHEETENLRKIAYWLFGIAGLVAGMVTVGGITRLTRSGLSMTDWKIQGRLPPITTKQWEVEFERYKQYPEWQQRKSMTLDEFKYIYYWEYGHRMMGRSIGAAFVGPLIFFSYKHMIPTMLYKRLGILFSLGATQGFIGWWMVKSGLEIDPTTTTKEIRVSPYRLATHLAMAFTTYVTLLWTGLDLLNTNAKAQLVASSFPNSLLPYAQHFRRFALFNGGLVAFTVLSGAYVAGNDAGHAYNTFPMMRDHWIPPEILDMKPIWKNFFENTATVQFDHRVFAMGTLSSISWMYGKARWINNGLFWKSLPNSTRLAFHTVMIMSVTQVGLGITTLLFYVPIPLAATHQAGSLVLLTFITGLVHSLKFSRFGTIVTIPSTVINVLNKSMIPFSSSSSVSTLRGVMKK